jgi:hypothetical protein
LNLYNAKLHEIGISRAKEIRMKLTGFFLGLMLAAALAVAAPVFEGRVVGVSDGDTLTLLTAEKQPIKIRLAEIDTPESKQPYGQRAKQALSELAFGKPVRVVVQDSDRYGRTVGRAFVGDVDVSMLSWFHGKPRAACLRLRRQALLPGDDELRRGKVLSPSMRPHPPGRR